tara:strand:- start:1838 stop:2470 length:633 start_codon:yes stop_codon:yes gene_type:complete
MILFIHTNEINLNKHFQLKNIEVVDSIGELNLKKANSISLKDEIVILECDDSKIKLLVGLKWVIANFKITSIIFFDYIDPINTDVLGNHFLIPKKIYCINDLPLEWGNNPYVIYIESNNSINRKIRNVIQDTIQDFYYGNIISIDQKIINETTLNELNKLGNFDAYNNLIFTCNKFAKENNLDIYNICIGRPSSKKNLELRNFFEVLNIK